MIEDCKDKSTKLCRKDAAYITQPDMLHLSYAA